MKLLLNNKMPWPVFPQPQPYMPVMTNSMPLANVLPSGRAPLGAHNGGSPLAAPSGAMITPGGTTLPSLPTEQSYVENILRMNLGKVATLYMTYENNSEWNAKIFRGVLEAAGRDHIIISDPATGKRFLLLTVNLDYITFDQPLNYTLPFGSMPTIQGQ
jgi:spore germination protein Q